MSKRLLLYDGQASRPILYGSNCVNIAVSATHRKAMNTVVFNAQEKAEQAAAEAAKKQQNQ
ncbi:hypothetical protein M231_07161 [Tremella mesenterica]|uniref:Uncharacterized protein n=1 Tax=Tremella mesenterica TaxID=5217 RepID=A0A4Q1BCS4_TREME|nr:hypothetical protein M231_07161 [Tremella mesenterica]